MCTNGTQVPCEVPSLPNPTTRKGWPHHRGLRPLLFSNSDVGSFTSHKNKSVEVLWDGTYGFRPYPRRLESLTICRCHFKGALPTEVARLISANFSYLWKFEPDVPNRFGEIPFEKPQNLQRMYRLINVLPPSNFAVFNCCYFFFVIDCKEQKCKQWLHDESAYNTCCEWNAFAICSL